MGDTVRAVTASQVYHVDLAALIDLSTDSVRCYRLDGAAVQRTQIVGIGQVTVVPSHYLIGGQRRTPPGGSQRLVTEPDPDERTPRRRAGR